jgi:hypothetical protein
MREFKDSVTGASKAHDTAPELPAPGPSETAQPQASREETPV